MVDNFSIFSIVLRFMSMVFLLMVLRRQVSEWNKHNGALKRFKILLMALVIVLFVANVFAILVNLFRQADGNLMEDVRHINQIFNGVSSFIISFVLVLLYDYHDK